MKNEKTAYICSSHATTDLWTETKQVYEVVDHVILTMVDQEVSGIDIMDISFYKEDRRRQEILLSSGKFKVISKENNELVVAMIIAN